jgi:hypothetical protein
MTGPAGRMRFSLELPTSRVDTADEFVTAEAMRG